MLYHQCLDVFFLYECLENIYHGIVFGGSQFYMYNSLFFMIKNFTGGKTHSCRKNNPSSRLCSLYTTYARFIHLPCEKKNLHPTEQFDISYTPLWKGHWTYLKTWKDVFLKSFHKRRFWKCRLLFIPQPECRCRSLLMVWIYFRIAWLLFFSVV